MALVFGAASCSNDYLDVQPVSNESSEQITDNVSKMRAAIFGAFEQMYSQYSGYRDYNFFNGESTVNMYYGEIPGQDLVSYIGIKRYGNTWVNWMMMTSNRTYGAVQAWMYYYGLISQANYLIGADTPANEEEIKGEYALRLAQAYTLRAHSYIRLHQVYGPRWQDSMNGARHSVVIRTEVPNPENSAKDVSSTNEVIKQIYDDLDRAIELYDLSGHDREYMWETNKSVAYGLYARAAILKEDWATAEDYAHKAAETYEVMSAADYESGFNAPTSEWMWCSTDSYTTVYYDSFGASWGCNGAYPCIWASYGAGAVDYTFYKQMQNTNDVRCELFYTPDKEGRALRAKFWNPDDCEAATMNINVNSIVPGIQAYCEQMYEKIGKDQRWVFPYTNDYYEGGHDIESTYIPFGAHFKFWGTDTYSSGAVCFMRSSEMLLIEAEAACHNGNFSVAQDCLEKINKNRITGYAKSTKTGDDLLAEVKLNRRWELWGEGFSWFDLKRWNEPLTRVTWEAANVNSGNWPESVTKTFDTTIYDGWVYPIPYTEIDYNDALGVDVNTVDYGL